MEKIKIEIKNLRFFAMSKMNDTFDCGEIWFEGENIGSFRTYLTRTKYYWTKEGEEKFKQFNEILKAEGNNFDLFITSKKLELLDTVSETDISGVISDYIDEKFHYIDVYFNNPKGTVRFTVAKVDKKTKHIHWHCPEYENNQQVFEYITNLCLFQ